jgi:hypothetical protein
MKLSKNCYKVEEEEEELGQRGVNLIIVYYLYVCMYVMMKPLCTINLC